MEGRIKIFGRGLDAEGRCVHYNTELDVAAMLCGRCGKYFACYKCHDESENHKFEPVSEDAPALVLCGSCGAALGLAEYQAGSCPKCGHAFNPRCSLHHDIYFRRGCRAES